LGKEGRELLPEGLAPDDLVQGRMVGIRQVPHVEQLRKRLQPIDVVSVTSFTCSARFSHPGGGGGGGGGKITHLLLSGEGLAQDEELVDDVAHARLQNGHLLDPCVQRPRKLCLFVFFGFCFKY
jgi:hypothetical protein